MDLKASGSVKPFVMVYLHPRGRLGFCVCQHTYILIHLGVNRSLRISKELVITFTRGIFEVLFFTSFKQNLFGIPCRYKVRVVHYLTGKVLLSLVLGDVNG